MHILLKRLLILTILIVWSSVNLQAERQIGKFKGNKFLFCEAADNQVIFRKLDDNGVVLKEKVIRKVKAKKFIKKFKNKIDKVKAIINSDVADRKKDRLRSELETYQVLLDNSKKCLFGREKKDEIFDPVDIDPNLSTNEYRQTTIPEAQGEVKAGCEVIAGSEVLAGLADLTDPLLAPLSGSLKCILDTTVSQDLVLKIFAKNSKTDPELLLTRVISSQLIDSKNSFSIPICTEKVNCFEAKKLNVAIQTTGINVEINNRN